MNRERQLSLNDSLNYVASILRNRPKVSLERMREIASEVESLEIGDADLLKQTILRLAEVEDPTLTAQIRV